MLLSWQCVASEVAVGQWDRFHRVGRYVVVGGFVGLVPVSVCMPRMPQGLTRESQRFRQGVPRPIIFPVDSPSGCS